MPGEVSEVEPLARAPTHCRVMTRMVPTPERSLIGLHGPAREERCGTTLLASHGMRKVGVVFLIAGLSLVIIGIVVAYTTVTVQGGTITCGHPLLRSNVFEPIEPCRNIMRDKAVLMWSLFAVSAPVLSISFVTLFLSSERRNDEIQAASLESS
ncbi:hypothetical protein GOAMI_10_00030 [Gordonia amicalis NBRC 100051 = JCM 11271]|nr:hypothetical protein GOAMI_10_00030 [Gordonia amicalis NBRC 100051 = JCM 11271]